MVMDSMVHREQFRTNSKYHNAMKAITGIIIILIASLFISCSYKNEQLTGSSEYMELNGGDHRFNYSGRLLLFDTLLFTGKINEFENGYLKSTTEYKNGLKNGREIIFYHTGRTSEERFYIAGSKEGEHTGWWESGTIRFIYHFKNDQFEGNVRQWNQNGMLFSDFNYKNGQEDGLQKAWFPDGEVQANYIAKDNRKYGITGVKYCKTDF